MNKNEINEKVLEWIAQGKNYQQGVMLYALYGKNTVMKQRFPGRESSENERLMYQLCKLAQIKPPKEIPNQQSIKPKKLTSQSAVSSGLIPPTLPEPTLVTEIHPVTVAAQYPVILRKVILEYAQAFTERSKLHTVLTEMPEGNSQSLKIKRAEILNLIKALTERLELFYSIREQYQATGYLPEEAEIWPPEKEPVTAELPDDPEVLRKMKKNQQSANTKDQNLLSYQSEKRSDKIREMTPGPKRMKLENRIKARIALINQIDFKILKINAV